MPIKKFIFSEWMFEYARKNIKHEGKNKKSNKLFLLNSLAIRQIRVSFESFWT